MTDAGRDLPAAKGVKVEGNSQMTDCSFQFPAVLSLSVAYREELMGRMKMLVDVVHSLFKICCPAFYYMNTLFHYVVRLLLVHLLNFTVR